MFTVAGDNVTLDVLLLDRVTESPPIGAGVDSVTAKGRV
jgi:hypothetical protein